MENNESLGGIYLKGILLFFFAARSDGDASRRRQVEKRSWVEAKSHPGEGEEETRGTGE